MAIVYMGKNIIIQLAIHQTMLIYTISVIGITILIWLGTYFRYIHKLSEYKNQEWIKIWNYFTIILLLLF